MALEELPPWVSHDTLSQVHAKATQRRAMAVLETSRSKLPDNILNIDNTLYSELCRICSKGVKDGEKNGIVRIVLSALNPSIFFVCSSVDKIKNFLHESLILSQLWANWLRFDKDGVSIDAIAEIFLNLRHEQLHFSSQAIQENDARRAQIRNLYRDTDVNHAAGMFFMEHPGLIPYAGYITRKLFPFGIGRNCYIGAGGNGVVIKNKESNLAFKFYYDLQRKKHHSAFKEGPSQVVFSRAINDLHAEWKYENISSPYMEVLSENHVEMELVDGETLDTVFKRFLLESNHIMTSAAHLRNTDLDIALRSAGLSIADYSIVDMLASLYGQAEADNFSYFLLELEDRWLTHRDIDSSIYSGFRTNVNPRNLMIRNAPGGRVKLVLIDFWNVLIENKNWHKYKERYDLVSKNWYV